jgi:hypothetical protein
MKDKSLGSEGARRATGEASEARPERGRFSAKRKVAAVMRLLRGEDLDRVSRELKVTAATLSSWRDDFLAGAEANLKTRLPGPQDEEILRLIARGDTGAALQGSVVRERGGAMRSCSRGSAAFSPSLPS